jgi:hypothetical protein
MVIKSPFLTVKELMLRGQLMEKHMRENILSVRATYKMQQSPDIPPPAL